MSALEAKEYGLLDEVIVPKKKQLLKRAVKHNTIAAQNDKFRRCQSLGVELSQVGPYLIIDAK